MPLGNLLFLSYILLNADQSCPQHEQHWGKWLKWQIERVADHASLIYHLKACPLQSLLAALSPDHFLYWCLHYPLTEWPLSMLRLLLATPLYAFPFHSHASLCGKGSLVAQWVGGAPRTRVPLSLCHKNWEMFFKVSLKFNHASTHTHTFFPFCKVAMLNSLQCLTNIVVQEKRTRQPPYIHLPLMYSRVWHASLSLITLSVFETRASKQFVK